MQFLTLFEPLPSSSRYYRQKIIDPSPLKLLRPLWTTHRVKITLKSLKSFHYVNIKQKIQFVQIYLYTIPDAFQMKFR